MKNIKLSANELDFLANNESLHSKIEPFYIEKLNSGYQISMTEKQADEMRDLCGEQLQYIGFDEQYDLTEQGKILETLIDKFFCG